MLRILHTSDWHLGQRLHDLPRHHEHRAFLAWLTDTLVAEAVDALIVAGDVFDAANPPSTALAAWYGFLGQAAARCPGLDVVVIGGNHDSAARLDAPRDVLAALNVHVVGGLPRGADRAVDTERTTVPLRGADGEVQAWVAAVPYLRAADLPATSDLDGRLLVEGARAIYTQALDAARARRAPGQALITTGHCYCVGGQVSESSERKVLLGNQHPLPVDLFGDDVAYVALGHLHLAQTVAGRDHVRYPGSPLPLSMNEARRVQEVVLVDLADGALRTLRPLAVPRAVELLRIPAVDAAPLPEVLAAVDALPARPGGVAPGAETLPYLEVAVRLAQPEPGLRADLDAHLADRAARLVRIGVERPQAGPGAATVATPETLADLLPEEVFRRLYRRHFPEDEPAPALLAAFHEMVEAAAAEPAEPADPAAPSAKAPAEAVARGAAATAATLTPGRDPAGPPGEAP